MNKQERKKHWDAIYESKEHTEFSWFQKVPEVSLRYFEALNLPSTARIIDVGGGNSFLVDYLLDLGYQNITVLDISETALLKTKERLGNRAKQVTWIVSDITDFKPNSLYDFWHDRAAFHFLSSKEDIQAYTRIANRSLSDQGYMLIGGFSLNGPEKCSGIPVKRYSEETISEVFSANFKKLECVTVNHKTPSEKTQNFIFCSFKKHN
ncbi:MAG TPA: class I SAM-dependent methyltransferase [Flavobacteriaceae bacterium]|nr:class I SAM-dependent methyltransferase [Flavobacteriaceae bacterium]